MSDNIEKSQNTFEYKHGQYIYLLQEREFRKTKENIYKIGKTKQEHNKRFNQYPKDSILLIQLICDDCDKIERILLDIFNDKFKKRNDIGNEYFEGNDEEMKTIICEIIKKDSSLTKYFFSGKICSEGIFNYNLYDYKDRYYDKYELCNLSPEIIIKVKEENHGPPDISTRIIVIDENECDMDDLQSVKGGGLEDLSLNNIIYLNEYLNLDFELKTVNMENYIITGPVCILDMDSMSPNHGFWQTNQFDISDMIDILNIRNNQMINNCDVFSLEVDFNFSCYRSFTEYGIAKEQGKILLIYFINPNKKKCSEFYTHIQDSLYSLDKICKIEVNMIIKNHPILSKLNINNYEDYKKYLNEIIILKNNIEIELSIDEQYILLIEENKKLIEEYKEYKAYKVS